MLSRSLTSRTWTKLPDDRCRFAPIHLCISAEFPRNIKDSSRRTIALSVRTMDSSVRAMKRVRMDSKLSTFSATAWVRCASVAMGPGSLQGKPQNLDVATLDSSVRRGATGSLSAGHRNLRDRAAVSTRMTKQNCSPTTDAIRCWVSASRKFGGRPADDPVPSDHIRSRRGRRRPRGPGSAGAQKADFVFGQPAHDHVLAAVPVEHPAQIGAGETLRVAVASPAP